MLSAKERNGKMGMPLKPSSFSLSFFFFCVCVCCGSCLMPPFVSLFFQVYSSVFQPSVSGVVAYV